MTIEDTTTPAVSATPPVVAAPVVPTTDPTLDPAWLNKRLEREAASARSKLLSELGVTDPAAAKAAIAAATAAAEAEKNAATKLAERDGELSKVRSRAEQLEASAKEYAGRMMIGLTPEQQKAVTDIAGDDAASQIKAIAALAPTWANAAAAAKAASVATPSTTTTQPGSAPPNSAPPPTVPGSPPDHRVVYSQSRKDNPFAAAAYGEQHPELYTPKT